MYKISHLLFLSLVLGSTTFAAVNPIPDRYDDYPYEKDKKIPAKDVILSTDKTYEEVVSDTDYYNLYIHYNLALDPTHIKRVVCETWPIYKTYITYTNQGGSKNSGSENFVLSNQVVDDSTDKSAEGIGYVNHLVDEQGVVVIHVVNHSDKLMGGFNPTTVKCRYVDSI